MGLVWHALAVPAIVVLVLGLGLAVLVVVARPHRAQNRRLAVLLVQVATLTGCITGLRWLPTDHTTATALLHTALVAALFGPLVYIRFLVTLDSPLVHPFRHRAVEAAVWCLTGAAVALWAWRPELFIAQVVQERAEAGVFWENLPGPLFSGVASAAILASLFGLAVALSAHRRASSIVGKQQAWAYAVAFGIRDVFTAANILLVVIILGEGAGRLQNDLVFPAIDAVFFLLLAYAMLKHQLFGIDLKVKFALRSSPLAMVVAAAFFLGKETLEARLPGGGVVMGILAAAVVGVVFHPVQRLVDRLADLAMPHVHDSPEYRRRRRREMYQAALEAAVRDGAVSLSERRMLERLRTDLRIGAKEAQDMERQARSPPPMGPSSTPTPL